MADANSVSDSQFLLQSMLQRLRLQPRPQINSTHARDEGQFSTMLTQPNGGAAESSPQTPPMYNFDFSTDRKSLANNLAGPRSPVSTIVPPSLSQEFSKGVNVPNSAMTSTPKQRSLNWGLMSNHAVAGGNSDVSTHSSDGVTPKQARKQKFSLTKMREGSVSSLQSVERLLPSTHTSGGMESDIQGQGVGQKRWTQKVKEKWKEKHKRREQDQRESKVANSISSPVPVQIVPNENSTTAAVSDDLSVQHQPINNGPFEGIPSPLDHMSETLFLPGSFNLMEEIFTGQEWAKFLPSSTSGQSASSSITRGQGMGLTSSISQSHRNQQTVFNQWNSREATDPNLGMTQSPMNPGSFHSMDTTEYMFNQRKTSGFSMPPMSEGQYGVSDSGSNHLESMDLSVSTLGNNGPNNQQVHIYPYNQSDPIELNIDPSLSSDQSMNGSQATEINNNQPGRMRDVLPRVDLSYLQAKHSSSLKTQVSLSRKRSHSTKRRDSNERCGSEPGETHEWRHNSSHSDPAPSLSPASSTSSLQHSSSHDSELSVSTETVIKKRRVENTRRVRFAEEVTIVPPLDLSDDDDGEADDEVLDNNTNEGTSDGGEMSPPRQSVPRWIEALRNKTKKTPKLKLPRMRTKKYRFV